MRWPPILPPLPTPDTLAAVIAHLSPAVQGLYGVADPAGQEVLDTYAALIGQFYAVLVVLEEAPEDVRVAFAEVYAALAAKVEEEWPVERGS